MTRSLFFLIRANMPFAGDTGVCSRECRWDERMALPAVSITATAPSCVTSPARRGPWRPAPAAGTVSSPAAPPRSSLTRQWPPVRPNGWQFTPPIPGRSPYQRHSAVRFFPEKSALAAPPEPSYHPSPWAVLAQPLLPPRAGRNREIGRDLLPVRSAPPDRLPPATSTSPPRRYRLPELDGAITCSPHPCGTVPADEGISRMEKKRSSRRMPRTSTSRPPRYAAGAGAFSGAVKKRPRKRPKRPPRAPAARTAGWKRARASSRPETTTWPGEL